MVHSGAFSTTLRCGEAYSALTLLQSHWSSSATIIGQEVKTPVPCSVCATRIVTVSSGAIVSQALISGTIASRYQGCAGTIGSCACAGGIQKPSTMAPPTVAVAARKSRRLRSGVCELAEVALMIVASRSGRQFRGAMDRGPDARISAAAADIGDPAVDVLVAGPRILFEQCHRRHDLPGLAIAALRHVELDPSELYRMRAVAREALDRGDGLVADARRRDAAGAQRQAIDEHRAGAALRDAAAIFGAGELERIAQHPEERRIRLYVGR